MLSFNAWTSILVEFESSFYVPFDCLAQPTLNQLSALFYTYYVMLVFHKVVEHTQVPLLIFVIKNVALHYVLIGSPVPHLPLPFIIKKVRLDVVVLTLFFVNVCVE